MFSCLIFLLEEVLVFVEMSVAETSVAEMPAFDTVLSILYKLSLQ